MATQIDPDILATLTDEERQAIEEGMTDSEKEALKALADEEGDDDDDDGDDDGEAGEGAAPIEGKDSKDAAPAPAADAKPDGNDAGEKAADAGTEAEEDLPEDSFKPKYKVDLPEDFDAQVKAVQDEQRTIAQQFKDGDIDFDEFEAKRGELDAKRDELKALKVKADIATEMSQQSIQQEWEFTVKSFVRQTAKNEGIDYGKDESKREDLDMFVKRLGADPKNSDKDMQWFLDEAHKRVKALHGIGKQEAAPAGDKKPTEKPTRKTPIDAAPKTLAQVPGSDGPGDVGDEFADLDSLDGIDLERAIAKMTPAQREKFAMGA